MESKRWHLMTSHLHHSAVQSDALPDGDIVIISGCASANIFLFFIFYCLVTYIKIACCWVGGGGVLNLSQKTHSEVCKCCLCIFVCKYIYTKHFCTKTLCGTPSLAKKTYTKKKHPKKVSTSFISIQFFSYEFMVVVILWLWILFTWLIGLYRAKWCWESDRRNSQRKEVPPNQPLDHTTATALSPEYSN